MVGHMSATLALVLLCCQAGILVVAQKGASPQEHQPPMMQYRPAPMPPQEPQPPKMHYRPAPMPPQEPQPPKMPSWPAPMPPQEPQQAKMPSWPAPMAPQEPQPPKMPSWPAPMPPQEPQPPKMPYRPAHEPPQEPQPPKMPYRPAPMPPQEPQPPKMPSWPAPMPPQEPQPPKMPYRPAPMPQQEPQPPKMPYRPAPMKPQEPQPPKMPYRPAHPPPQEPQPPKMPYRPAPMPPQEPQPPKMPSWPAPMPPQEPQPPKMPFRPAHAPPQEPQPPKMPYRPAHMPPQEPQPPKMPYRPAHAPPQEPQPPKMPYRPAHAPPQEPQPPNMPSWPAPMPPQKPQPPKMPSMPAHQSTQYRQPPQYPQVQHDAGQRPKDVQAQHPQEPQLPPAPPTNCDVAVHQRVPCGVPHIEADACNAISCCFDNHGCYYGKAVTVQCTKDAQFIVVVARDATLPNIDLESIALLGSGAGCAHVDSNSLFAIYNFPVTACGSIVTEEPGVIVYENRMFSSFEVAVGPLGSITRDSSYELLFQCRYIGTSVETLVAEVLPLEFPSIPVAALGPIDVELRLGNGKCDSKGCDEEDAAYSSYYVYSDYPVTKVLRQRVFIELRLKDKTDPNLVLTFGRCWTTSTPHPHSLPQWDICVDGCPYVGDRYQSAVIPVDASSGLEFPSHYKRIMFQMFAFVEPNALTPLREQIYIHCSTAVCVPGPSESCEANCHRRNKRDVSAATVKKQQWRVATVGPLTMTQAEDAI